MTAPFTRTIRYLQQDGYRLDLALLAVMLIVLSLWLGWFFAARVAVSVSSTDFTVDRRGVLQVVFPAASQARLRPGQPAEITVGDGPALRRVFRGEVLQVAAGSQSATAIYVFLTPQQPVFDPNSTGTVSVVVAEQSPAQLTWSAINVPAGER